MPRKRKEPTEQERENPTLASFQVNAGAWYYFGTLCEKAGISASQGLTLYIMKCLENQELIIESENSEAVDPVEQSSLTDEIADIKNRLEKLEKKQHSPQHLRAG